MRRLALSAVIALALGPGGAIADPPPESIAAPGASDTPVQPDAGQPPAVMEQHDVPPPPPAQVAPPDADKPDGERPAAATAPTPPADQKDETSKNVAPVAPSEAFSILGKKVHGPDGKDAYGSIIDVLVDDQGQPRAAIIDFGGFLGVGNRKIAVDWQLLKFNPADQAVPVVLDLDRSQIQSAPEYKDPTHPAEVVEPALLEIPPTPPVADTVETPVSPADAAPPVASPLVPLPIPSRSVAAPAPSPPESAPPPDADKHAN